MTKKKDEDVRKEDQEKINLFAQNNLLVDEMVAEVQFMEKELQEHKDAIDTLEESMVDTEEDPSAISINFGNAFIFNLAMYRCESPKTHTQFLVDDRVMVVLSKYNPEQHTHT